MTTRPPTRPRLNPLPPEVSNALTSRLSSRHDQSTVTRQSCSVFKKITENPLQKVTEQVVNSTVGGSEDNLSLNLIRDAASTITAEQEHYLGSCGRPHLAHLPSCRCTSCKHLSQHPRPNTGDGLRAAEYWLPATTLLSRIATTFTPLQRQVGSFSCPRDCSC